jgi:hypothetical protein
MNKNNQMKDKDDDNRKDFRRENINNRKKYFHKPDQAHDFELRASKKTEIKKKKEELDEEDWEEWERFYNR